MFAFHCVFSNSLYCRVCLFISRRSHFADFVSFLSMIFYEVLYTWCFRYNIYSSWFLDIRISTCLPQKYFTAKVFYYRIVQILTGNILTDTDSSNIWRKIFWRMVTAFHHIPVNAVLFFEQFDVLNFDGLVRKCQKHQNFSTSKFCAILYTAHI